jgi:hypothetical protein
MSVLKKALDNASTANNITSLVKPDTVGWNGDLAYSSTMDGHLDLFFSGLVRGCPEDKLNNMLRISWCQSPDDTLKIILHSRDRTGGKGEKHVSFQAMLWLRKYKPLTYILNLAMFLEYGCFKDLLHLAAFAHDHNMNELGEHTFIEIELLAEYLQADLEKIEHGETSISLAAKWAPSEGKHFDQKYNFAKDIATLLYPNYTQKESLKKYRLMLSTLRKHLNIVETFVSQNKWNEINYSHVPARAHKLLRKAFLKHCPEEYKNYLTELKASFNDPTKKVDVKINFKGIHPHELVRNYLRLGYSNNQSELQDDDTIEAMWYSLIQDTKSKGTLSHTIAISDVSGSMTCMGGLPLQVSISIGILIAQCCTGIFHNKLISFSDNPEIHSLKDDETLKELVEFTQHMPWGMSTDLDKVFDLLLNTAQLKGMHTDDMIKNIIIISDLQVNQGLNNCNLTAFQRAKKMFEEYGYVLPTVTYWNVAGKISSFPVTKHQTGALLISGFSAELLKDLISNGFDIDPINFLLNVINKYEVNIHESEKFNI